MAKRKFYLVTFLDKITVRVKATDEEDAFDIAGRAVSYSRIREMVEQDKETTLQDFDIYHDCIEKERGNRING